MRRGQFTREHTTGNQNEKQNRTIYMGLGRMQRNINQMTVKTEQKNYCKYEFVLDGGKDKFSTIKKGIEKS